MKKFLKSLQSIWTILVFITSPFLFLFLISKIGLIQGVFAGSAILMISTLSLPTLIQLFRDVDKY